MPNLTSQRDSLEFKLANGLPARIIRLKIGKSARRNIWIQWTVTVKIDEHDIYIVYPGYFTQDYIIHLCQNNLDEALTQSVMVFFDWKVYLCSERDRKAVLDAIKAKVSPCIYPLMA